MIIGIIVIFIFFGIIFAIGYSNAYQNGMRKAKELYEEMEKIDKVLDLYKNALDAIHSRLPDQIRRDLSQCPEYVWLSFNNIHTFLSVDLIEELLRTKHLFIRYKCQDGWIYPPFDIRDASRMYRELGCRISYDMYFHCYTLSLANYKEYLISFFLIRNFSNFIRS